MSRSSVFSKKLNSKTVFVIVAIILLCMISVLLVRFSEKEKKRSEIINQCNALTEKYSEIYSLDYKLVMAVIDTESGFDPKAVSHAGACGLMQLMPSTFEWMTDKKADDIFDAETNIAAGCKYLAYLFERFDNEKTVLAAYNAGEGNVSDWLENKAYSDDGKTLKIIPYPETADYVSRVVRKKADYSVQ